MRNNNNHEKRRIPLENHEHHENRRIPLENYENHEYNEFQSIITKIMKII